MSQKRNPRSTPPQDRKKTKKSKILSWVSARKNCLVCVRRGGGRRGVISSTAIIIDNNKPINELNKGELGDGGKGGGENNEMRFRVNSQLRIH